MSNKVKLKRLLLIVFIFSIIFVSVFIYLNIKQYKTYSKNNNYQINSIISNVREKYPDVPTYDIINNLNKDNNNNYLKQYGYDLDDNSLIENNNKEYKKYFYMNIFLLISVIVIFILLILLYDYNKTKEIKNITKLIEEINKKNYALQIDEISEDELSILKNELYKVTIMLKEDAENSKKEKLELKESLENISHQLKTPLTSILIILDNLIDDKNMSSDIREDFIKDIKREITNINFLIQTILKLSKIDTNTINYNYKKEKISNIINEVIKNVSILCELKSITIDFNNINDGTINCDPKWEIEAITNIVKNCIEHSYDNNKIEIEIDDNKVYSKICVKDYGPGIDKKDINHIFERFYKSKNSTKDSVGIGLSLAKSIIEKDNGNISVESSKKGTTFTIKYYK